MNFTEEQGQSIPTVDISAVSPKKKRGRPKKTTTSTTKPAGWFSSEPSTSTDDPLTKLVSEKEKLKNELLRLSDHNPDVITKPVNDKLARLVEDMSIEELRERVRFGKRNQASKMDGSVAAQTITIANQLTGRFLGCLEELNETSVKDKLLNECVKDYMCLNILDYIPNELKIGGLYGSHVANAYYTSQQKQAAPITNEAREKIKQALADPNLKLKMEELKSKLNNFQ
jgi:hypothetical protein